MNEKHFKVVTRSMTQEERESELQGRISGTLQRIQELKEQIAEEEESLRSITLESIPVEKLDFMECSKEEADVSFGFDPQPLRMEIQEAQEEVDE